MALEVVGSTPTIHPILFKRWAVAKSVRHQTLTLAFRRFESCQPSQSFLKNLIYGPLAQLAEHLTFNQGVPRSNRGWITTSRQAFWFAAFLCQKNGFTLSAAAPLSKKAKAKSPLFWSLDAALRLFTYHLSIKFAYFFKK